MTDTHGMRRLTVPFLLLLLLTAPAGMAHALSKGGVTMPDDAMAGGKKLVLNGLGVREATVFKVDVYVAGLYLEKKTASPKEILAPDRAKKLVLQFVRDVDQSDLTGAWTEGFQKNGGQKLKADVHKLNRWMAEMKEGETLELTYLPEGGTTVSVKGKKKGTIGGADFARVMWKIFIGPKPPNSGLKEGLLGK